MSPSHDILASSSRHTALERLPLLLVRANRLARLHECDALNSKMDLSIRPPFYETGRDLGTVLGHPPSQRPSPVPFTRETHDRSLARASSLSRLPHPQSTARTPCHLLPFLASIFLETSWPASFAARSTSHGARRF